MNFTIIANQKGLEILTEDDFEISKESGVEIYGIGLLKDRLREFISCYKKGNLLQILDQVIEHKFLVWIHDNESKKLILVNDKFGSNEIFFAQNGNDWI